MNAHERRAAVATAVVVSDIRAERARQVSVEGWTPAHDDQHAGGDLAVAAACYAFSGSGQRFEATLDQPAAVWPWDRIWWKPKDRRRDLVRAAALIVAEIERLDRLTGEAARAVKQ